MIAAAAPSGPVTVTHEYFGRDGSTGVEHELVSLRNASGLSASFTTFGAQLVSCAVPSRDGCVEEVSLNYRTLDEILKNNTEYFGATIGRYANRISDGVFQLDGATYSLACNDGPHHSHGGVAGFDKRAWAVRSWCEEHSAGITFSLVSRDGEEGYPGTVRATAEYRLTDANELVMTFSATTDKATLVNLCNHAYWNLSGGFKARVLDHDLRIAASSIVGVDDTLVPKTGALVEVADTPFDFRSGDLIGRRIYDIGNTPPGYDHCYVLDRAEGYSGAHGSLSRAASTAAGLAYAATLHDSVSGRSMTVWTTKPGVQLYTSNFLPDGPAPFSRHNAVCLETMYFPDSVKWPRWPSPILRPGQSYCHATVHSFSW